MRSNLKEFFFLICAGLILASLPLFWANQHPIEVSLPQVSQADVEAQKERQQKEAVAAAARDRVRRVAACEADEDRIIVDKDPCGCLIGPQGVTAINALHTLEFNKMQSQVIAKTCPDTEPSTEKECSETAQAVCSNGFCKIVY